MRHCLAFGLGFFLVAGSANAAPITRVIELKDLASGATSSIGPVNFDFSVSFDNAADIAATDVGLTVTSLSPMLSPMFKFVYTKSSDTLSVGNLPQNGGFVLAGPNKFGALIAAISTNEPLAILFGYSDQAGRPYFSSQVSTIASVPEPATWAMMVGGFGLIGSMMRRRRSTSQGVSALAIGRAR
ncbi:PEPxxWA-CTERM sorting domain-containing protein [Sphingomonas sp. BIUV-7]|uniref:PEPxxWA-CTERM sorting domain-containing protein n=1 Tax=Sphingomonas natans TaxID=3063330 RepID=A0ABT8YCL5_9SPHN|nr:PEPxxWA-CTERM sorting domain-containing protein [Sphingomonas sp. BIUV-7]MDO6416063.1 PEPxxWA-CTERM sorting domain-containing protein [Sphingomonas sp. BIUV-7]